MSQANFIIVKVVISFTFSSIVYLITIVITMFTKQVGTNYEYTYKYFFKIVRFSNYILIKTMNFMTIF